MPLFKIWNKEKTVKREKFQEKYKEKNFGILLKPTRLFLCFNLYIFVFFNNIFSLLILSISFWYFFEKIANAKYVSTDHDALLNTRQYG